jgi:hypothetical protein
MSLHASSLKTDASRESKQVVLIRSRKPLVMFDRRPGYLPQVTERGGLGKKVVNPVPPR